MSLQYERAEQDLYDAYDRGELSTKELNTELRELQRDFQGSLEDRAQDAYDRVMDGGW